MSGKRKVSNLVHHMLNRNYSFTNEHIDNRWWKMVKDWIKMYNEEGKIPDIKKGTYKAWYTYQQVKLEGNALSEEQINALDRLPGWTWRPRCLVKILQKDIDALLKKKESLSSTINSNLEVIKEQQQRIAEAEAEAETEALLVANN